MAFTEHTGECSFFPRLDHRSPCLQVIAVGWGTLFYTGPLPQSLQQVTLGTVDYRASVCREIIDDPRVQLCATVPGGAKGDDRVCLVVLSPICESLFVQIRARVIQVDH